MNPARSARVLLSVPGLIALLVAPAWPGGASSLEPRQVQLSASLDPREVTVGDPVRFEVRVTTPEGYQGMIAESVDFGGLELLGHETVGPVSEDGVSRTLFRFVLAAYETGDFEIPPIEVRIVPEARASEAPEDPVYSAETEPATLAVRSVLDAQADSTFRPLKGQLEIAKTWTDYLWIAWVLLAIAAVSAFWWIIRRVRKDGTPAPVPVPTIDPHEWAFRELRRLKGRNWIAQGEFKLFYSGLSDIVRGYLGRRFAFPAPDLTSSEILSHVDELAWEVEDRSALAEIMAEADLVKFAKLEPPPDRAERALQATYELVHRTMRDHPAEAEDSEAGSSTAPPPGEMLEPAGP